MNGTVYLVGAGPGDPGLITCRGRELLERADVVVYDRLVEPALLAWCRADAELIDAGKAPGAVTLTQAAINALLVERARAGLEVVRLKGGDPFVFGRGGEEALACSAAGVPVEIVPGVTSATAAAALAGIPVTHRGLARALAVVTGHGAAVDWRGLRGADTLVVLMAIRRLDAVVRELLDAGWSADTPAAVVLQASLPHQRVLLAPLARIAERAAGLGEPGVLVVGAVTALAEAIRTMRPHHPPQAEEAVV